MYTDKFWGDESKEIIKHSPNLIDLIEVGDYVNGYKILSKEVLKDKIICKMYEHGTTEYFCTYKNNDIKSILTREQFNSMKYEVK